MDKLLKFSSNNSKMWDLARSMNLHLNQVVCFDLPAGYTCPAAVLCQAFADKKTGKIRDGKFSTFRCYAASGESRLKNVRASRWHNMDLLDSADNMVQLIQASLPKKARIIRVHSSGDFFNEAYFMAWVEIAKNNPSVMFFGYSKVLAYVNYPKPENFRLVYSFGGRYDSFITESTPVCYVVNNEAEAERLNVKLSCVESNSDDYDFIMAGESFALTVHGTQKGKKGGQKKLPIDKK